MNLSVVILTFNEAENLPRCLESIRPLGCDVFVVDSGSTDGTRELARQWGATVAEHPFVTHALQWDWALRCLPVQSLWALAIDADQSLTPELAQELKELFWENGRRRRELDGLDGLYVKRRQVFRGRWIKHGGYYPKYLLKLFRRDRVRLDANDLLDHHFYVAGPTGKLRHDLVEANHKEDDIAFWISKHNRYASLMAREEWMRNRAAGALDGKSQALLKPSFSGNPDQRTLRLKRMWWQLPLFVRPWLYFLYRYLVRFGWLDGKEGLIFHFLQGLWFRLLVDINLDEIQQRHRSGQGVAEEAASLETGSSGRKTSESNA